MPRPMLPLFASLLLLTVLRPAATQAPPSPAYHWHSLVLQHAAPSDVLRQLHWDGPGPSPTLTPLPPEGQTLVNPTLPAGVRHVFALQRNNSLLIQATPDGYARVKQIVQDLDVAPHRVEIKVEFVTAGIADVDNVGINFDLIGLPSSASPPGGPATETAPRFLAFASGGIVPQLYQTLRRTLGRTVSAPLVTTPNGVAATVSVDARVVDESTPAVPPDTPATRFPQLVHPLYVQGTLTLTPHVHADGTVGMEILPPTGDKTVTLRAVHSGDPLVFIVPPAPESLPVLGNLFRTRNRMPEGEELLIFVTPTILGESTDHAPANAAGGQSVTVTP